VARRCPARHPDWIRVNRIDVLLAEVQQLLQQRRAGRKWYRRWAPRAAVAMALREQAGSLSVLMIERASRVGDPWSGHMAFPGGMMERTDRDSLATARRETAEEVGLELAGRGQLLGRLSEISARAHRGRWPMVITPYVFALNSIPRLKLNHEVADTLWVPLSFFIETENRQSMRWRYRGVEQVLPCYLYRERRIWGLSLMMLDELLALLQAEPGHGG